MKFAIKYPDLFGSAVAYGGGAIDLERTQRKFVLDILKKNLDAEPALIQQNNTYHFLGKNHETVRRNGTRFLLICGAEDTWLDTAESFHAALTERRIPCELKIVPEVSHQLRPLVDSEGVKAARFQNEVFVDLDRTLK